MNEQERCELDRLKRQMESLRLNLDRLWAQTQQLEARLMRADQASSAGATGNQPVEIEQESVVGVLPQTTPPETPQAATPSLTAPKPPRLPPHITAQPPFIWKTEPPADVSAYPEFRESAVGTPPEPPSLGAKKSPDPDKNTSFEMKLGTVWLVRIGIVMILTGLVFFGNLAYHNFISKLGAGGKIALMYVGGGLLLGLGAWLRRKQELLRNYAQVLFAGGLAAVYFTTYAAHHLENLEIIQSATLDGLLLLGWAGFMAWLADRKKSELLAIFAVGLAYYTSIITDVGLFTLYSNLVLTAAGVIFFVRNRWAALSFGSLLATYGGYTYWRFYVEGQWLWHLNLSSTDYQLGNLFLLGYWLLFTAAVFLSRHEKFNGEPRAAFLSINNAGFFGLVVLARWFVNTGSFWKLSLCFGAVLLGLAALAVRRFANEKIVINSFLSQGLTLVTLGLITYFTGLKLAAILAAESVILLILACQRKSTLLHVAACLAAALATGWAVLKMRRFDRTDLFLGTGVGLLLSFNAFWSQRQVPEKETDDIQAQTFTFSALALLTWLVTTWNNLSGESLPLMLAVESVLLTASFYLIRVRAMAVLGQLYLFLGQVLWLREAIDTHGTRPWWNPVLLIGITFGLSHWWQRQKSLKFDRQSSHFFQGVYALVNIILLFFWLRPLFNAPVWLAFTSLLAIVLTIYGLGTRLWLLAAWGQLFLVVSGREFFSQLWRERPGWYVALTPMAALCLISFGVARWLEQKPDAKSKYGESVLPVALVYRWAAVLMSLAWIYQYIPARERFWALALAGAAVFWQAGWRKSREGLLCGAVFTATGFWLFWFPIQGEPTVYLPNLLAILLLLGQQRLARRLPGNFAFDETLLTSMILLGGASLWRFTTKWVVLLQEEGFYLTVAWAVLALLLFVAGLLLSERIYRWLGLGILGCALGRVMIFDVWKLETLYRILSFMALGIVLLVLGFIYNKYQEKIKQWL